MDVTLPNGVTIYGIPEGTTKDQIMQKAISSGLATAEDFGQQAQSGGLMDSVRSVGRAVSNAFTGNDRTTPEMSRTPELPVSGLLHGEDQSTSAAITPALLTATNPDEVVQIIQSNFPDIGVTYNRDAQGSVYPILANNKTGATAMINKPGMSAMDVMQGLGIAAAYTPAGRGAGLLSVGAKSAATESALQGAQSLSGGDFDGGEVALSAGLGAGMKGVENLLGTGYRAIKGNAANVGEDLVQAGRSHDIDVMTSDVFPPGTFIGKQAQQIAEKVPLVGTGKLRQDQQLQREEAVARFADEYSDFSYSAIVDSLKNHTNKVKRAAGSVMQAAGEKLDAAGELPTTSTRAAIDEVGEILSRPGVLKSQQPIDDLASLKAVLDEAPQSFTMLQKNRGQFRDLMEKMDSGQRSQLTSREKALMQRVYSGMTEDMENFAKANMSATDFAKWKRANSTYAEMAGELKDTRLKNVLDKGSYTPEAVNDLLLSRKPSEVAQLYRNLTSEGRDHARSAIISRVVDNVSRRQSGLTPNSFATELEKYGPQIKVFFRGQDADYINGLRAVLSATRRAQDASVSTPTGQQLMAVAAGAAGVTAPTPTAIVGLLSGTSSRLYETPAVRDALRRLGSVPPRSTRFEKALGDLSLALQPAAQTARAKSSEEEQLQQ